MVGLLLLLYIPPPKICLVAGEGRIGDGRVAFVVEHPAAMISRVAGESRIGDRRAAVREVVHPTAIIRLIAGEGRIGDRRVAAIAVVHPAPPVVEVAPIRQPTGDGEAIQHGGAVCAAASDDVVGFRSDRVGVDFGDEVAVQVHVVLGQIPTQNGGVGESVARACSIGGVATVDRYPIFELEGIGAKVIRLPCAFVGVVDVFCDENICTSGICQGILQIFVRFCPTATCPTNRYTGIHIADCYGSARQGCSGTSHPCKASHNQRCK